MSSSWPRTLRTSLIPSLPSSICVSTSTSVWGLPEPDLPAGLSPRRPSHATIRLLYVTGRTKAAGCKAVVSSVHEPTRKTIKTAGEVFTFGVYLGKRDLCGGLPTG